MRFLTLTVLAIAISVSPVLAQNQPASQQNKQPNKTASQDGKAQSEQAGQPPPASSRPEPKDDTMTNFDVNGSNAADAMGAKP